MKKDAYLQLRLPHQLNRKVKRAAAARDMTTSEFVRLVLDQKMRALDAAAQRRTA